MNGLLSWEGAIAVTVLVLIVIAIAIAWDTKRNGGDDPGDRPPY